MGPSFRLGLTDNIEGIAGAGFLTTPPLCFITKDGMEPGENKTAGGRFGEGWTLVALALGISLIACCLLLPQMDENRRAMFQCEKLKIDLAHLEKQAAVNQEFIRRVGRDPALAERLAQRQMKFIRQGSSVLDLKEGDHPDVTPYSLVTLATPAPLPEYRPVGGMLATLCRDAKKRLYLIGAGLMLMAMGLVLGNGERE